MARRRSLLPFLLLGAALLANAGSALASTPVTAGSAGTAQYTRLVWSDEFTGSAGTAPNVHKWVHDVGAFGWTDNELQTYTASPANASLDGRGDLAIIVRRQTATGPDRLTRNYTSAKLETQGLFSARYGTFVARMQLPAGAGLWPAFWMVGDNYATVGWPASGEIDAMEAVGQNPFAVSGTIHGPSLSSPTGYALGHTFRSATALTGGFHVYGVTWNPTSISWTVDGRVYGTTTTAGLLAGWGWPFTQPFHLILNLALGGTWTGPPNAATPFPSSLLVDWVRVYQ